MARPKSLKPAYCLHKSSGRAFVKLDGHRVYLGRHGSQESHDAYDRAIGEWIARGRQTPPASTATTSTDDGESVSMGVKVLEVASGFWEHAQTYYRDPDGNPTAQLDHFRLALKLLNRLYGESPAAKFGPLALKVVRAEMLKTYTVTHPTTKNVRTFPGWSRQYANEQTGRLKRVFKWAVENEMLDPAVYGALTAVENLQAGKSTAREGKKVRPVPVATIAAIRPKLSRQIEAMMDLQILTGARPGEICAMRTCDLDTTTDKTGKLWYYHPERHKTQHHGHERTIYLGRRCQKILNRFRKLDLQAHIFSPAEAVAEMRERRSKERNPANVGGNHPGTNRKRHPKRTPGTSYDTNSYRKAIDRACRQAGVPAFHPHQLRHNAATSLRKEYGIEVARIILGHRSAAVTTIYAEVDAQKASEIMAKIG